MSGEPDTTHGLAESGPSIAPRTVVGVFDDRARAEAAFAQLRSAGVPVDDLSIVMRPPDTPPEMDADATEGTESMVKGASAGALLGGALGLAAVAIPGIGPLLIAGPLLTTISGALAGGVAGAWVGSIAGLGVPKEEAEQYAEAVRSGGIFVAARVPDEETAKVAGEVLEEAGAREVGSFVQM